MKKKILFFLSLFWIYIPLQVNAETLVFSAIGGNTSSGSPLTLISEAVLKEAYGRMGIKIVVKSYPGLRAIQYSNSGKTDGEIHRIEGLDIENSNLIIIPVPVNILEEMVLTKNCNFEIKGWASLQPYNIGILNGVIRTDRGTSGLRRHTAYSFKSLFEILNAGRVDVIIATKINALHFMQEFNYPNIKMLEPPVESAPLYHYLHKKHRDLVSKITLILQKMEKEGVITDIRTQFSLKKFGNNNQ